MEVVSGFFIEP